MNDPFYLVMVAPFVVAFSIGALIGWKVRSGVHGCLGIGVLLIAVVGGLLLLYDQTSLSEENEGWEVIGLMFYLFFVVIVWIASAVGWGIARAIRGYRGSETP